MDNHQKCPNCGEELKSHWTVCPNCSTQILKTSPNTSESKVSTPVPVEKQKTHPLVYIAVLFLIIFFVYGASSPNTKPTTQPTTVSQNKNSEVNTVAPETKAENWRYEEKEDKINNSKYKIARCQSANTFDFKFPYSGSQHAYLVVRQNYDGTKDVLIRIEKGQFMTSVLGGKALVRFDDNKPESYSLLPTNDGSTTVVFIKYADAFISALEKSKKIYFQTDIYQEGSPTMEFNVEGLRM